MTFRSLPHNVRTMTGPSRITNIQYSTRYSSARPSPVPPPSPRPITPRDQRCVIHGTSRTNERITPRVQGSPLAYQQRTLHCRGYPALVTDPWVAVIRRDQLTATARRDVRSCWPRRPRSRIWGGSLPQIGTRSSPSRLHSASRHPLAHRREPVTHGWSTGVGDPLAFGIRGRPIAPDPNARFPEHFRHRLALLFRNHHPRISHKSRISPRCAPAGRAGGGLWWRRALVVQAVRDQPGSSQAV
jgi:hypothetical protein